MRRFAEKFVRITDQCGTESRPQFNGGIPKNGGYRTGTVVVICVTKLLSDILFRL
jgi:hypothetical protein